MADSTCTSLWPEHWGSPLLIYCERLRMMPVGRRPLGLPYRYQHIQYSVKDRLDVERVLELFANYGLVVDSPIDVENDFPKLARQVPGRETFVVGGPLQDFSNPRVVLPSQLVVGEVAEWLLLAVDDLLFFNQIIDLDSL